jgi:hypothetical protein
MDHPAMNQRQLSELLEVDAEPMKRAFADYGVRLEISNGGHHWRFYRLTGTYFPIDLHKFAEWWPSTGKLALDRDYKASKRANTALDAERILHEFFGITQPGTVAATPETKWLESSAIFDEPERFVDQLELGDTPPFDINGA